MYEYSKLILKKVSFNRHLFWKEYKKFRLILPDGDGTALKDWTRQFISSK